MTDISDEVCEEFRRIILEGVEQPGLRRMLEHLIRSGKVQTACIIKDMYAPGFVDRKAFQETVARQYNEAFKPHRSSLSFRWEPPSL
jgi:hypothetical protein